MKKGCLIAAGVVFAICLLGGLAIFFFYRFFAGLTAPVAEEGDRFLKVLGEGKPQVAYEMASQSLRQRYSAQQFVSIAGSLKLDGIRSTKWNSRKIENDRGFLEGVVTTGSGATVPMKIELIKENGLWRVFGLQGPPGTTGSAGAPPVPSPESIDVLVQETMGDFSDALRLKSFDSFHSRISELFRAEITSKELSEAFRVFLEKGRDLSEIRGLKPTFDSPATINEKGWLVLEGHYPTAPETVVFRLSYVKENEAWKLAGIRVRLKGDSN